jgi:hypothetical protein
LPREVGEVALVSRSQQAQRAAGAVSLRVNGVAGLRPEAAESTITLGFWRR